VLVVMRVRVVEGLKHGVLMEVNRLHVMLVVMSVVQTAVSRVVSGVVHVGVVTGVSCLVLLRVTNVSEVTGASCLVLLRVMNVSVVLNTSDVVLNGGRVIGIALTVVGVSVTVHTVIVIHKLLVMETSLAVVAMVTRHDVLVIEVRLHIRSDVSILMKQIVMRLDRLALLSVRVQLDLMDGIFFRLSLFLFTLFLLFFLALLALFLPLCGVSGLKTSSLSTKISKRHAFILGLFSLSGLIVRFMLDGVLRAGQMKLLAHNSRVVKHGHCLMMDGDALLNVGKRGNIIGELLTMMHGAVRVTIEMSHAVKAAVAVMVGVVGLHWLHLDNEVAVRSVDLLGVENAAVGLEAAACLVPATAVEGVEIVAPVELKFVQVLVVGEDFDVIVKDVPGHVSGIEALTPRVEGGRPEVHSHRLGLVHQLDSLGGVSSQMAHLVSIDGETDVIRGPFKLVDVPVVVRVEAVRVVVILELVVAVAVNHVRRERITLNRGHNLDIELVPATRVEPRTVPVSEEG